MYVLFQPIGIAGGLQSVALFARSDIHFLRYGVFDKVGIECHLLVGAGDILEGEICRRYLSLFPTSKKLSQSIWMFLMEMLLHWHCSYIIIYWFFLYVIYDKLVTFYVLVLRKARKTLKYR